MKKNSENIILIIIYLASCMGIIIWNIIAVLGEYRFFSIHHSKIMFFVFLIFICIIIPIAITCWLIKTRKKQSSTGMIITTIIISIVVSVLTTGYGLFVGYAQSKTTNITNYGEVDESAVSLWEDAENFFPDSLDRISSNSLSYNYQYTDFVGNRNVLFDLKVSCKSKGSYDEIIKILEESDKVEKVKDSFVYILSPYKKGYVATDDFNKMIEFHYEYGKMEYE